MRHRFVSPSYDFIVSLTLAALLVSCGSEPATDDANEDVVAYANWDASAEYVGREVCQSCHPDKYDSFIRSQMGRSWKPATATASAADFDHPDPIYSESDDLYYQPFQKGEDIFVREYRLSGADTTHLRVQQINYIVGSGQHTNSHIYDVNGYLYQIPVTWYVQAGIWGLAPGFESGNSRFSRPITEPCMACHNGYSDFEEGSENRFQTVASGIGCERCHGPGSIHVESISAGNVVDITKEIDYTIVNPAKLSPDRQLDLCMRCHMQGAEVFADAESVGAFRPGQLLSETVNVFWPRQPDSVEVFNMASHPDRLAMSACFQSSWEEESSFEPLTCTTCHDPHVPIEETDPQLYRSTCQNCHETQGVAACSDPDVRAGANTAACSSCHMPQSPTQDIPHVQITDHFIRVVNEVAELSPQEIESRKRFIRLASLVNAEPTDLMLADGLMSYYELITNRPGVLDTAEVYLQRAGRSLSQDELAESYIRLWYLTERYADIRRYARSNSNIGNSQGWTLFRIGEAFAQSSEYGIALSYLEQAVESAPNFLRFADRLASAYTSAGNTDRAIEIYDQIAQQNPQFEDAIVNRGYARLISGQLDQAEADFQQAIELYPDARVALGNLASLYASTGEAEKAIEIVNRLLELDPENVQYQQMSSALRN